MKHKGKYDSKNSESHKARKRFGQNFLHDQGIIDRIIRTIRAETQGVSGGQIVSEMLRQVPLYE